MQPKDFGLKSPHRSNDIRDFHKKSFLEKDIIDKLRCIKFMIQSVGSVDSVNTETMFSYIKKKESAEFWIMLWTKLPAVLLTIPLSFFAYIKINNLYSSVSVFDNSSYLQTGIKICIYAIFIIIPAYFSGIAYRAYSYDEVHKIGFIKIQKTTFKYLFKLYLSIFITTFFLFSLLNLISKNNLVNKLIASHSMFYFSIKALWSGFSLLPILVIVFYLCFITFVVAAYPIYRGCHSEDFKHNFNINAYKCLYWIQQLENSPDIIKISNCLSALETLKYNLSSYIKHSFKFMPNAKRNLVEQNYYNKINQIKNNISECSDVAISTHISEIKNMITKLGSMKPVSSTDSPELKNINLNPTKIIFFNTICLILLLSVLLAGKYIANILGLSPDKYLQNIIYIYLIFVLTLYVLCNFRKTSLSDFLFDGNYIDKLLSIVRSSQH